MQTHSPRRTILRRDAMKRRTGNFTDSTYQRWEAKGLFPKRIQIGPSSVGWFEDEIDAWAESRERAADAHTPPRPSPNKKARHGSTVSGEVISPR